MESVHRTRGAAESSKRSQETEMTQEDQAKTQPQTPDTSPQGARPDSLPPIAVAVEDSGTLKKKIAVTVPRARIDAKFEEMFGELATTALVPGFRIGHAPRKLIEKRFGKDVSQDVRNGLVGESLGEAMEKSGLKTIGEPAIDLEKIELPEAGDLNYSYEVEIAPEFQLPALEGIEVTRPRLKATRADADAYIEQYRRSRARHEATDEPAAPGDVVTAGAKITGEGIEPLEKPGLTLRVAPGQIEGLPLVDLGEALAGKKAGDTATLTLTVPDAHPNESWRGKKAQVEINVSQVRRTVLPEFNQALCDELGFASTEQFQESIQRHLAEQVERQTQQSLFDQVVEYLLKSTQFEVPEGVAARHAREVLARRYLELLRAGIPTEKIDENLAQLQAHAAEQARTSLKVSFILAKVAEQYKLQVEPGEVNARIAEMAARSGRRPERLRQELEQQGSLESLQTSMLEEKAVQSLLAAAKITDAPEQPADEEAQAGEKNKKEEGETKKPASRARKPASRKKQEEKE
jgi:trigger factor